MNKKYFLAAMYLRLSRDDSDVGDVTDKDGRLKSESNSIGNQRELIRAFIHEQNQIFQDTGNINADMFCIAIAV